MGEEKKEYDPRASVLYALAMPGELGVALAWRGQGPEWEVDALGPLMGDLITDPAPWAYRTDEHGKPVDPLPTGLYVWEGELRYEEGALRVDGLESYECEPVWDGTVRPATWEELPSWLPIAPAAGGHDRDLAGLGRSQERSAQTLKSHG